MHTKSRATVEDLYHVPEHGKAELVNGELVLMSPTGIWPSRASGAIYFSLRLHERAHGGGRAYTATPALSSISRTASPSAPMRRSMWGRTRG